MTNTEVFDVGTTQSRAGAGRRFELEDVLAVGVERETKAGVGGRALRRRRVGAVLQERLSARLGLPVLLVDDDSEVRAATAEMLRYVGHDVIEAAGGREALDRLDRERDGVDLMIVDYVMPGMNGLEVARLGRLRRPGLHILFVTGFADTAVLAAETTSDHILRKPFTVADLVAKIGAVLRIGSTR